MKLRIIDRYILRELSAPFFASLSAMTFVLLLGRILQLMDLMINKGIQITDIGKLILFLMPYFLLFTIPISLLLSILIGLGRLASDNEILILRGAGLSLYRLAYPIAGAAVLALAVTMSLSLFFVPRSNYATKNLLFSIVRQNASAGIKEKVFNGNFRGLLLYASHIPAHGNFMEGVLVSDNRLGKEPNTIVAERGYLISDPKSMSVSLRMENGSTHTVDMKRKSYRKMDFTSYDINLDLEASAGQRSASVAKESMAMTPGELIANIRAQKGDKVAVREMAVELNRKFTIPLTCLIFALLGIPLGIRARKSGKTRGLTTGIIVVLLYYLAQLGGTALTETGKISVWIGLWFPNVMFTLAGTYLLVLSAQERERGVYWQGRFSSFFRQVKRSK